MCKQNTKPGKNGYKIIFNTNTVVMNYKFAKLAGEYGTEEYNIMKGIRADFPGMTEVVVSGREQKSPRTNRRFTYENMESHIRAYTNAEDLLEVFESVKALSKVCVSPYKYVCDWFNLQFPNYNIAPTFKNNKLFILPVDAPDITKYEKQVEDAAA